MTRPSAGSLLVVALSVLTLVSIGFLSQDVRPALAGFTPVPTATPTNTPVPPTATSTNTPVPTVTPTNSPVPTATPTRTPAPSGGDDPAPPATSTPATATPAPTPVAAQVMPQTGSGPLEQLAASLALLGTILAARWVRLRRPVR